MAHKQAGRPDAGCALRSLVTLGAVYPVPDRPGAQGGCANGSPAVHQPKLCTDPKGYLLGSGPQHDDGEWAQVPDLSDFTRCVGLCTSGYYILVKSQVWR